jgi:TPR repeat protein
MKMGLLLALLALPDLALAQQDPLGAVAERVSRLTAKDIPSLQQKSASGDPQAQFMLGLAYSMGAGVKTDAAKAFNWVSRAAESGHMMAENELGSMYA